jgi:hypothetical protein
LHHSLAALAALAADLTARFGTSIAILRAKAALPALLTAAQQWERTPFSGTADMPQPRFAATKRSKPRYAQMGLVPKAATATFFSNRGRSCARAAKNPFAFLPRFGRRAKQPE